MNYNLINSLFSFLFGGSVIYWQWEAMVTSYLSQRVMTLPFNDLVRLWKEKKQPPNILNDFIHVLLFQNGLVDNTDFRIAVTPGSAFLDTFKLSNDPVWSKAYKTRIEPYLEKYKGKGDKMIAFPTNDKTIALYDNFYSVR